MKTNYLDHLINIGIGIRQIVDKSGVDIDLVKKRMAELSNFKPNGKTNTKVQSGTISESQI